MKTWRQPLKAICFGHRRSHKASFWKSSILIALKKFWRRRTVKITWPFFCGQQVKKWKNDPFLFLKLWWTHPTRRTGWEKSFFKFYRRRNLDFKSQSLKGTIRLEWKNERLTSPLIQKEWVWIFPLECFRKNRSRTVECAVLEDKSWLNWINRVAVTASASLGIPKGDIQDFGFNFFANLNRSERFWMHPKSTARRAALTGCWSD